MSEYQSVHFPALDRPLDDKQLAFMRQQSTRAEITQWDFSNEYHYGDFRGDPVKMMQRGFDLHLHYANFGIRRLMIRFPSGPPCEPKILEAFLVEDSFEWLADKKGKGGILSIEPEADAGTFNEDLYDAPQLFHKLAPLREMLIGGDLRPLYIAWLAVAYDEESLEPPVPAGLGKASPVLEALAEFYELDVDLLAAAAANAPQMRESAGSAKPLEDWLARQTPQELQELAARLLGDDATACRAETLARIRDENARATWPLAKPERTLVQLRELAEEYHEKRTKREEQARETKRRKRLATMAANPSKAIAAIEELVQTRSTENYNQAARELADLRDALGPEDGPAQARVIAAKIRSDNPRRSGLVAALRKHGLLD